MTKASPNIYQRLAAAMKEVQYIQKDKPNGMKYSIVSHDAVTAKVRPALLKQGVVYHPSDMEFSQNGNRTEVFMRVNFVNIDKPDDCISVPSVGYGIDNQDKGPGKAMSYAVKYALLKALGLETGDDPDLDQTTEHEPEMGSLLPPEQVQTLNDLADEVGADKAKFCQYMGVPSFNDINPKQYQVAVEALEKKRAA